MEKMYVCFRPLILLLNKKMKCNKIMRTINTGAGEFVF